MSPERRRRDGMKGWDEGIGEGGPSSWGIGCGS